MPHTPIHRVLIASACLLWTTGIASAQPAVDYTRLTARSAPAWLHDGFIYELNVRTFSPTGNFAGVTARLPELKQLGVSVVWLMPIHPLGQVKKKGSIGSPYAVRDYYGINPAYGTADDLKRLVAEAHRVGLKVIIDVVANHTSWDNVMMKVPSYYKRDASGQVRSPYDWTDVAALDYGNPALRQYMTDMLVHWIRDFDLDGFRCDVAGEVPTDFWVAARAATERVKPGLFFLAEADHPDLLAEAFDMDYGWAMYHAMSGSIVEGRPATVVREAWEQEQRRYPRGALHLRIADDHDERRAVTRFGERGALPATVLVFTLDGVPVVYNGQEVGDATESRDPALFEQMPVFWNARRIRPWIAQDFGEIVALRKAHPALRTGELEWVGNSDADRILTFIRRDATEEVLVTVNLTNRPFAGTVQVSGAWTEVTPEVGGRPGALPALSLEAWGVRVFARGR